MKIGPPFWEGDDTHDTQWIEGSKAAIQQWNNFQPQLQRLNMLEIRPTDAEGLFALITYPKVAGQIGFEIGNVTFNVPERANDATDI